MDDTFDDIDRLRREGPAYTGDEGWETLPQGPMDVVLSVRFDARAMLLLTSLAKATNRTPSALLRDWTIERLAGLATPASGESAGHQVAEATASYRLDDDLVARDNEQLRAEYRPSSVRLLFVGESSPASGRFFYRANSNLFHATREAFVRTLGPMPSGTEFLNEFRSLGAWLVDLADRPVNRQRGRPRADAVDAGIEPLADLVRRCEPELLIGVKATLEAPIRSAAHLAGLDPAKVHILQFPVRQWRSAYIRDLTAILTTVGPNGPESTPPMDRRATSLHEAIREVLRETDGPVPARAIANQINRRHLYTRKDGRSLDYQQILARARRYPALFEVGPEGIRMQ